jgi:formylglycine-generating enzyme required for sulfatase activity
MFRLKDVKVRIVCLVFIMSGTQTACAALSEPDSATTSQPSPSPTTITPTSLSTTTVSDTPLSLVSTDHTIDIPNGNPIDLDGTIKLDEWNDAKQELFSDGSELLMMHHEGYLYLAIRANTPGMIVGNIFINQNDYVTVFHSSAALGTAIYEQRSDSWEQIQAFSWRCRGASNSASDIAEREAFLQQEHWLANNSRMGTPNELEYKVAMLNDSLRLAVTFTRASDTSMRIYWPIGLEDDCTKSPQGEFPTTLHFAPSTWMTIRVDNTGENINNYTESQVRPPDQMTMVFVPGGTFQMGSTETEVSDAIAFCKQHYNICNEWFYMREYPQHTVTIDDFWIDKTEVTNAQYRQCVEADICVEPITCKKGEPTYYDDEKSEHPVVCVSWDDAQTYCEWADARLPSEAEWEFAFRGEQNLIYPWGNTFDGTKLNYCDVNCELPHADDQYDDRYEKTAPVGSYPEDASWCGALDMSGNISEWVADWSGNYSTASVSNPTGPPTGTEKILRGCNWYFQPAYCRGAARPFVSPDTRYDYLGFRCATSISP